mgnify:FL=1
MDWIDDQAENVEDLGESAVYLYDEIRDWIGDQYQSISDAVEEAHEVAVNNTTDFIEDFVNKYEEVKQSSINDVRNFLNETLDELEDLSNEAKSIMDVAAENIGDFLDDILGLFTQAEAIGAASSPLVLDLDGDGLELSPLDGSGIHFDHDVNQYAELTGWVSPDDGFLVYDRNANGTIDDGTEVFGDNTPINGGTETAADGFAALAEFDTNANGVIDASDTQYSDLRVWRDLNQDGLSTTDELKTLSDHNIVSIDLNAQSSSQTINGHSVPLVSTFTRSDGSSGDIGDVFFEVDKRNTRYIGDYELKFEALLLPKARGYGNVADLHIAMSQNETLKNLVQEFSDNALNSLESINQQVDRIIIEWTGSANVDQDSRGGYLDARKLESLEAFMGEAYYSTAYNTSDVIGQAISVMEDAWETLRSSILTRLFIQTHGDFYLSTATYNYSDDSVQISGQLPDIVQNIFDNQPSNFENAIAYWANHRQALNSLKEELNISFSDITAEINDALTGTQLEAWSSKINDSEYIGGTNDGDAITGSGNNNLILGGTGNDVLDGGTGNDTLYGGDGDDSLILKEGYLYGGAGNDTLVMDGYASAYFTGGTGSDTLEGGYYEDRYYFNLGDGQDTIDEQYGNNAYVDKIILGAGIATTDVALTRSGNHLLINVGASGDQLKVKNWYLDPRHRVEELHFDDGTVWDVGTLNSLGLEVHGTGAGETLAGLNGHKDVIYGHGGDDTITGLSGNDTLYGDAGNDVLDGGTGIDTLYGGDGDDSLILKEGYLYGGAGNDTLVMDGYASAYFTGGTGSDTLEGGYYEDRYYFNLGDGQDTIDEQYGNNAYVDKIILGAGIATTDVALTRSGNHLLINVGASGDQLKVKNWYLDPRHRVEELHFDDGTVWDVGTLESRVATSSDDTLTGTSGNDYLAGLTGNDTINAGDGNDILDGGPGNDILRGGAGDDTFWFTLGDKQDQIEDTSGNDTLNLENINHDDLWFWRKDNDLRLGAIDTQDWLTIQDWYAPGADNIETMTTPSDSYVLTENMLQQLVEAMAVFDVQSAGDLNVPQQDQDDVQSVIAAAWSTS